jgi:hypothetical protein
MQMTLLQMVQNIMAAMDSDAVNSIDDTTESLQVADAVKEAYFDLVTQRDWPFLKSLTTLTGLGDTDNPTKMRIPTTVNKVLWIRYNKKPVEYMPPSEFKKMIDERVEATGVVGADGYIINADPQYWTTYDDDYIIFDGYNSDEDSTLQESKSSAYVVVIPEWEAVDGFVPTLPAKMFPTLLADAKGSCFLNLKQQANAKEETKARRGRSRFQNEASRTEAGEWGYGRNINYGRK